MIKVGLAVCDLAVDEYALARIAGDTYGGKPLEKLEMEAVELQIEDWERYNIMFRGSRLPLFFDEDYLESGTDLLSRSFRELKHKKFKSFHGPINTGNISCPDKKVRDQAIAATKKAMDAAATFGVNIFVLHASKYDWNYWEQFKNGYKNYMDFRKRGIDLFLDSLKQLSQHYAEHDYEFPIGIENLEFNQFPSTQKETWKLLDASREVWEEDNPRRAMGVVLDIQHLKHSKVLLEGVLPQPLEYLVSKKELEELVDYASRPICRDYDYVVSGKEPIINQIFKDHLGDILLLHLAGNNHRHATHDPILYDVGNFDYRHEHYKRGMLNIKQVLDNIYFNGYDGEIIMEVRSDQEHFGDRFEEHVETLKNVEKYLAHLRGKGQGDLKC